MVLEINNNEKMVLEKKRKNYLEKNNNDKNRFSTKYLPKIKFLEKVIHNNVDINFTY